MIKTQVIKENKRPIAVILDYEEYMRLKAVEEDADDYVSASGVKRRTRKWTSHEDMKKKLGLAP